MYDQKPVSRLRRLVLELCESRVCLSTVAFAAHDIECCAAAEADSVGAADLDGDGDLDVLSSSRLNNKIAWYENTDGQGTFGAQRVISIDFGTLGGTFTTPADLDGDGDMDVLSASSLAGKIAWYENVDGRGGFGRQQVITSQASSPRAVTLADVDGDGDWDVLSATIFENKIAWYENTDGGGTFGPAKWISTDLRVASALAAADVDSDGDLDVVLASLSDHQVTWYENTDGGGTFGPRQVITTEAKSADLVAVADVDGDGDVDVLSGSFEIAWYENTDSKGSFGPKQVITTQAAGTRSVALADVDGDGDQDLFSASVIDGKIAWYENTDGRGTFGPQRVITTRTRDASSVAAADLDGDGDLDALSASYGDHKVAWYENTDGQGDFGPQKLITTEGASFVAVADVDGDGDLDVLSASGSLGPGQGKIAWYENIDGQGTFGFQQVITSQADGAISVAAADLDGDGDLDVLSALFNDDKIAWYENLDGLGNFGAQQIIAAANGASSVAAADLDEDGDLDVLFGSSSKLAWHKNTDGQPRFAFEQVLTTEAIGTSSVAAADLDGDGDLDVVFASGFAGKIAWYENADGLGTFGPQQVITAEATGAGSVVTADVDGDGDLDVLSASSSDHKIAWYENTDGKGTFGPQQLITTQARGARSVVAADVDGDGDLDVLSASLSDGQIAWYENTDGNGSFGPPSIVKLVFSPTSLAAADVDGDGDLDVLFSTSDKIGWYEQRLLGDVNDDGVFDSSDLVRVFRAGEYEDRIVGNSGFEEGDWSGDGEFDSADLVLAFQAGHYERGGQASLAGLAAVVDRLFANDCDDRLGRPFAP